MRTRPERPAARRSNLVVKTIAGEVLVYDLEPSGSRLGQATGAPS